MKKLLRAFELGLLAASIIGAAYSLWFLMHAHIQ